MSDPAGGPLTALRRHQQLLAAWEWGEHQDRRNRRLHLLTNVVMVSCAVGVVGHLVGVVAAAVLVAAMAVVTANLDPLAGALSLVLVGGTVGGLLSLPLAGGLAGAAALVILGGGVGALALVGHRVFADHHAAQMSGAPGGRTPHVLAFGAPVFVLFALLDAGWRPAFKRQLVERSRGFFGAVPAG